MAVNNHRQPSVCYSSYCYKDYQTLGLQNELISFLFSCIRSWFQTTNLHQLQLLKRRLGSPLTAKHVSTDMQRHMYGIESESTSSNKQRLVSESDGLRNADIAKKQYTMMQKQNNGRFFLKKEVVSPFRSPAAIIINNDKHWPIIIHVRFSFSSLTSIRYVRSPQS